MSNKCETVRSTCKWVANQAKHVIIHHQNIAGLADRFSYKPFNSQHFHQTQEDDESALLQLFMLDGMNFCFWPIDNFQYEQLATHVQTKVKQGVALAELMLFTEEDLVSKIFNGIKIPLASQRARILRQIAEIVVSKYSGSLVKLIKSSEKSAVSLLNILTNNFPNFQDHSIYKGHQIHFYKHSQLLISHIYNKFSGKGIGEFSDIDELTVFADYRIPQLLWAEGVFEYGQQLREVIMRKEVITDREMEAEIRASTVVVGQLMKAYLQSKGVKVVSIELDAFLWQLGESSLPKLPPHHRCLTIYY